MNREIKFRGKSICTGKWLYGSLAYIDDQPAIICGSIEFIDGSELRGSNWDWVDSDTISQYTGCKDHNGAEIYEGDLLQNGLVAYEVVYDKALASFVLRSSYTSFNGSTPLGEMLRIFLFELIGNHWDNPELLEDKDL